MNEDEAKKYLLFLGLPHSESHVTVLIVGFNAGRKTIIEKVAKRFKISHVDWHDERS